MGTAFANPERAASLLAKLTALPEGERALALVQASADPDMALLNLTRYLEAAGEPPPDLGAAVALFAGSQSMSEAAIREPGLLVEVLADRSLPDEAELSRRAASRIGEGSDDPRGPLRAFVRTETLRLLLDDLTGRAGLEVVAGHLSRVAGAAIDAALSVALAEATARYGTPRAEDGRPATVTVIGLGKLGGGELNYSSDIDILFLYSEEGRTDAEDPTRTRRNRDFFTRVVERARSLLADATPAGHCYRVDLRLRPEGQTGALTRTVASALEYYRRKGRPWERQALIKARPVAGDLDLGRRGFIEPLASFVYGAPLRLAEIRSIKELKRAMERRDPDPRQVKAGPGGIRDVEYTVQFLQLLHGHRHPSVRRPGTLAAIARLEHEGALTPGESRTLQSSYVFLRTVEHRLQTMHEVRTHTLPADRAGLLHLANRMGLSGEDPLADFERRYARHTTAARQILARLFTNLFLDRAEEASVLSDFVLQPDAPEDAVRDWLHERGFADAEQGVRTLGRLARGESPRARKFLASLSPRLLLHAAGTPEPDRCLTNFERVVLALGAPATFYQLLTQYPDILSVFTDLCGWSQHLTNLLARNPAMIDAFADSLVVAAQDGWQPWDDLPLESIESEADPARVLHDLKDLSLIRIGVRDIQGKANTENTLTALTRTAERILALAMAAVGAELAARHGPPAKGARADLAVLGLGKLGAGEMSYASDLDLSFVMDAHGRTEGGMEVAELLSRLAQGVVRLLGTPRERGRLYEVDTRVRPDGRSGSLVTPVERFERYYEGSARVAELQMLTKARFVAGNERLGRSLESALSRILYGRPPPRGITDEVRRMRGRIEETARGRDVKRGFGGIVDIEFLVECLKLLHGHRVPTLRTPGTLSALAAARRERLITGREHEALLTAMQFLRSVESRMRIVYDMALAQIPETEREQSRLARRLGYVDTESASAGEALLEEYGYHTARTREVFDAVLLRQSSDVSR